MQILSWHSEDELHSQIRNLKLNPAATHVLTHTVIPGPGEFARVSVIPHDAEAFARALYAELHECDESGAELIIIEALPETNEWQAIADRLRRASV